MHIVPVNVLAAVSILVIGNTVTSKITALEENDIADHNLSTNINFLFDVILKNYTRNMEKEGKTQIKIAGFKKTFSIKIISRHVLGGFVLDDGLAGNVSTLHRTGNAEMNKNGSFLHLSAHLGLSDLEIDYGNYDIFFLGIHHMGRVHATVGANSLLMKMKVVLEPSCVISLEHVTIEQLEDIKVDITNLCIFEEIAGEIASWVVEEVIKNFRNFVEKILYPDLSKAVIDADLCHYF